MKKQEFIKRCNAIMANITDPKRRAANRCVTNKKAYKLREVRDIMKRKLAEQKVKQDAKSKL